MSRFFTGFHKIFCLLVRDSGCGITFLFVPAATNSQQAAFAPPHCRAPQVTRVGFSVSVAWLSRPTLAAIGHSWSFEPSVPGAGVSIMGVLDDFFQVCEHDASTINNTLLGTWYCGTTGPRCRVQTLLTCCPFRCSWWLALVVVCCRCCHCCRWCCTVRTPTKKTSNEKDSLFK